LVISILGDRQMPAYTGSNLNGKQFSSLIQHLSQQRDSRFAGKVRTEQVMNAEEAYFNLFSPDAEPTQDTTRHGATPWGEYDATRRKVIPYTWEAAKMIDKKDVARMTVDPQNPVVQSHAMSFARKKDRICYEAMIGTALEGKEGGTSISFADDSISINGDGTVTTKGTAAVNNTEVPMTYSKILTMMSIFNEEDVDPGIEKFWAVSPNDIKHMMNLEEIINEDYRRLSDIDRGGVRNVLGFNFFWWNYLDKDAVDATSNRTVAWAKDGVIQATIGDLTTTINILPEHKQSTGVYSTMDLGAVRMEGAKVHECLNLITQTLPSVTRNS
jgi:hypothetical protein